MLKQIIIGGIVGGITLFVWGFVSWVVLTWHHDTIQQHDGVSTVVENVTDHISESGVYYFPPLTFDRTDAEKMADWEDLLRAGPRGYLVLQAEPGDPMAPMVLIRGFVAYAVAAMMASLLLIAALPSLPNYRSRVVFVAALGVFTVISCYVVAAAFEEFPLRYTVGLAADTAIAWILAGITIAAVVKPRV